MKAVILYGSLSGNTKKIATAIASVFDSKLIDVSKISQTEASTFWTTNDADIYILGSGIYADRVNTQLKEFLTANPPPPSRNFALFATWIGRGNSGPDTLDKLTKFLLKHSSVMIKPYFLCFGKMLLFKTNHPDDSDIENAKKWVKSLIV